MRRTVAILLVTGAMTGCLSPNPKPKPAASGKAAPELKSEAAKAQQLPLVLPDTITEQNHKQKLQAFERELSTDRESGGRAYVDLSKK